MFGLMVLIVIGLYLLISFAIVRWSVSYARKNEKSAKRWGWSAALMMFLIPFWDWIPTVATHQYYCATEAGFWVYKTSEQWKKENPGVMETLVTNKGASSGRVSDEESFNDTYLLNQRFNKVVKERRVSFMLPVFRHEQEVVDTVNNLVTARYVDFRSGFANGLAGIAPKGTGLAAGKFWLVNSNCSNGKKNYGNFLLIKRAFQGVEK